MSYTAADVKRLREETDAPMMECKAALEEAGGDFEKAKAILREKGKAAAAKRAERSTAAGVVAIALNEVQSAVGAVVLECETDFVARNEDFIATAQRLAEMVLHGESEAVMKAVTDDAVAKIRENIRIAKKVHLEGGHMATYVHHDRTKGMIVQFATSTEDTEALRKVAVHATAFPPAVVNKDELSQERLAAELEIETQRAINEGKNPDIAKNIAQGRVNKEFVKTAVLMEQPFYTDPGRTVGQYLEQEGKGASVKSFVYLAVGQGPAS